MKLKVMCKEADILSVEKVVLLHRRKLSKTTMKLNVPWVEIHKVETDGHLQVHNSMSEVQ